MDSKLGVQQMLIFLPLSTNLSEQIKEEKENRK